MLGFKRPRQFDHSDKKSARGRYSTTMYFAARDSKTQLSNASNSVQFDIARNLEDVTSVKISELTMRNTLSPFTLNEPNINWTFRDTSVAVPTGDTEFVFDLSFDEYAFDRTNISELGVIMTQEMVDGGGPAGGPKDHVITTFYESETDYIGFLLTRLDAAPLGLRRIVFKPDIVGNSASFVFGLHEAPPNATGGVIGVIGELGEYIAVDDTVWSNGQFALEGDTQLIVKCDKITPRSTHSGATFTPIKSDILTKINLGNIRGSIVRYGDFQFSQDFTAAATSLSGAITFSLFHTDGSRPLFKFGTDFSITLDITFNHA